MFERHYAAIRRFVASRLRSKDAVEDLVQETFARTLAAHGRREVLMPQAFLFQTAANLLVDHHRRAHVHESVIDPAVSPDEVDVVGIPLEEELVHSAELSRLRAAIGALPPRRRDILVLHKIEGYSHVEIANRLGVSTSTVEKHIVRAMVELRVRMKGEQP